MKLTVALGLQYDSATSGAQAGVALPQRDVAPAKPAEAVIDLPASAVSEQKYEFSQRDGFFFLTYSLQGLPLPVFEQRSNLNLYV